MATYAKGPDFPFAVAADYSSTGQYRFMAVNSSGQAVLASVRGQKVLGVLQDDPAAAGRSGTVRTYGSTKVYCGGTFAANEAITTDANGAAIQATLPTDHVIAYAVEAGSSGIIAEVHLVHQGLNSAESAKGWAEDYNALDTTDQVANIQPDGTAADGTADVLNHSYTPSGNVLAYEALGAGQTITGPVIVANGLNISGDQTEDEGYEVFSHFLGATGKPFVIGKDPAFYFLCKLSIANVSGTDDLQVGFRRAEICRPAFDDYLDAAAIGIITSADPAAVQLQTILNNGATVETDTTDTLADTIAVQFKVLVSAAGVVTYQHDLASPGTLAAPTAVAAFTFDNGDPVIPFVRFLHAAAPVAGEIAIHKWEAGYQ